MAVLLCDHGVEVSTGCVDCEVQLRTQLAEATARAARAERAERECVEWKRASDRSWTALNAAWAERDEAKEMLCAQVERNREDADYRASLLARITTERDEARARLADVARELGFPAHLDQRDPERGLVAAVREAMRCVPIAYRAEQAESQLAEARRELDSKIVTISWTDVVDGEQYAVTDESLTSEEAAAFSVHFHVGIAVRGVFVGLALASLRERAEQAESHVLSDETVRTVRELLRELGWDEQHWSLPIDRALAELDAKYPDKGRDA